MTLPSEHRLARVVVCDDDAPTLELLCDHLEAERFAALPAPSAADALRLCHYNQPDLLLLDLNLPDAGGLDVLREIRASEGTTGSYDPDLPVIVLSGRSSDADRVRGLDCGADDYVVKPFHIQEVVVRMRAVLRRRDGRRTGADPRRRDLDRHLSARGARRRQADPAGQQGVRAAAHARHRSRPTSSPRRSCCETSGATARSDARARSTRTRAACAESSTPSPAASSSTAGGSDTA